MDCHRNDRVPASANLSSVRPRWRLVILSGSFLICAATGVRADDAAVPIANQAPIDKTLRNDAALADVCFVAAAQGWAVGDRGVIWHTADGGTTWQQQASPVACRLNSVFFIDSRRGWAVGGEHRPFTHATQGIVLRTETSGETWVPVPGLLAPLLTRVRLFDAQQGVALGEGTSFYPSGVFLTNDSGQTWQPLPADHAGSWLAGDFLEPDAGAVAGPAGRFATIARRQVIHSPLATSSLRSFHAMRLVAPTGGWLVGDGGLVMTTSDLGHSWQTPPTELPDIAEQFDFHAVAVEGPQVWVAGSPGTRVFHSPDAGQSWQVFPTGQFAPLRALSFVDADHGWAVGELGTILATKDGGRAWQVQRAGGQRAALLAVFAEATDVPLEVVADQGVAEGYITAVDILRTTTDDAAATEPDTEQRTRAAMILAGAAAADTAWRFPLPPGDLALAQGDVLAALNRANDGRAIQQLDGHLVRQLRMWQPEVIITHHAQPDGSQPLAALVEQLVLRSVAAAADPTQYVELASDAGLTPWQVKKVYGLLPPGSRGDEAIATGRFSPWLGATLADWSDPARRLLYATYTSPLDTLELALLMSRTTDTGGPRGLFSGVALSPGSAARRSPPELPANNLDDLRRMASRRKHLQQLLKRSEGNAAWAGQVANLTEDLDANGGGELLFQLAEGYRATGRLDLAADTYYLLARRYPDHPLVDQALVWLVQFYASSEAAHRSAPRGLVNIRQAVPETPESETPLPSVERPGEGENPEVQQTAAVAPIGPAAAPAVGLARDDRLRRAVQLAKYLQAARPMLYAEPTVRFAEVAAQRQLGYTNPAKRYFLTLRQLPENESWRQCATTEEWLAKPADLPPPKILGACRPTSERPHLDGQLDEPFWQLADRLRLHGDVGQTTVGRTILSVNQTDKNVRPTDDPDPPSAAEIRLVYDQQFLYVAVRCPKTAGGDYRPDVQPRPRDADLTQHDRIALRLDIDRDFSTAFELTVDHRGWTRDACWDDATWDPNWYVAAAADDTTWTVEAAVPLAELVAEPPAAKHVWAVAIRRTIPRVGYESWAGDPAAADSPDQFGLLIFE